MCGFDHRQRHAESNWSHTLLVHTTCSRHPRPPQGSPREADGWPGTPVGLSHSGGCHTRPLESRGGRGHDCGSAAPPPNSWRLWLSHKASSLSSSLSWGVWAKSVPAPHTMPRFHPEASFDRKNLCFAVKTGLCGNCTLAVSAAPRCLGKLGKLYDSLLCSPDVPAVAIRNHFDRLADKVAASNARCYFVIESGRPHRVVVVCFAMQIPETGVPRRTNKRGPNCSPGACWRSRAGESLPGILSASGQIEVRSTQGLTRCRPSSKS